jgi:hypothetical protein
VKISKANTVRSKSSKDNEQMEVDEEEIFVIRELPDIHDPMDLDNMSHSK